MRESFAIDKEKLYGFDFDNKEAAAWAQDDEAAVLEEEAVEEPIIADEATDDEVIAEDAIAPIGGASTEISAKEAFFEFARGVQPHPMPVVPPRPPHVQPHPMPTVPPRPPHVHPHPMPVVPPRPGHNFNPHSGSAPRFAPPAYIPQQAPGLRAVDPGAISRCLYSNTYIWLNNRQDFWFFPTFIGRRSIAGYRWMHRHWVFMGFSLNMIDSFFCGGR